MQSELKSLQIFLSFTVVMDAFNGFATNFLPPITQQIIPGIRAISLLFLLVLLLQVSRRSFVVILALILLDFISVFCLLSSASGLKIENISTELTFFSKVYFFVVLAVLIHALVTKELIGQKWIKTILHWNFTLMPFLYIVPTVLGISRQTYVNSSFGNSGFFIANNSSDIVLILASIYFVLELIDSTNTQKRVSFFFLGMSWVALWIQGSKTSIISVALELAFLLSLYLFLPLKHKSVKSWQVIGYFLGATLGIFVVLYGLFNLDTLIRGVKESLQSLVLRQQALYKAANGNLLDTLFSGRISRVRLMFMDLDMGLVKFNFLFGAGVSLLPVGFVAEMDLVDLYIDGGLLLVMVVYGLTMFYLFYRKSGKHFDHFAQIGLFVLIVYSLVAGHVYKEILASTFVALLLSYYREGEVKYEDFDSDTAVSQKR